MKNWFFATLAFVVCACATTRADDVADARNAFDIFCQYSRTANERLPDLFAPDVSVTSVVQSGNGPAQDKVIPSSVFLGLVRENVARKESSRDTYKDIDTKQEGDTMKVTATRVDERTGFSGPFVAILGKDASGQYKIKALKFSEPSTKTIPGEEPSTPPAVTTDIPVPKATP